MNERNRKDFTIIKEVIRDMVAEQTPDQTPDQRAQARPWKLLKAMAEAEQRKDVTLRSIRKIRS